MVKCSTCNEAIEKTFLDKIRGTYLRDGKKLEAICSNCQRKQSKQ